MSPIKQVLCKAALAALRLAAGRVYWEQRRALSARLCVSPMKFRFLLFSVCMSVASALFAADRVDVAADSAWVRWLPNALPAAGYMTLENQRAQQVELVAASSPDYARVTVHQTLSEG